jgi:hypothetical protein
MEKGATYPGLEVIAKLATVLEVEPAELLRVPAGRTRNAPRQQDAPQHAQASLAAQVFVMGGNREQMGGDKRSVDRTPQDFLVARARGDAGPVPLRRMHRLRRYGRRQAAARRRCNPLTEMNAGSVWASLEHQLAIRAPLRQQVGQALPIASLVHDDARGRSAHPI